MCDSVEAGEGTAAAAVSTHESICAERGACRLRPRERLVHFLAAGAARDNVDRGVRLLVALLREALVRRPIPLIAAASAAETDIQQAGVNTNHDATRNRAGGTRHEIARDDGFR